MDGRSHIQCRQRRHCVLDPSLKKGRWTAEDDKLLYVLYLKYGDRWNCIALEMNGRTEAQCKRRWMREFKATDYNEGPWMDEEDTRLAELHSEHGNKWACIAPKMNGRSKRQCRERWCNKKKRIHISNRYGRWTDEEDKLLINLYKKFGNNWHIIASEIDGKSNKECRQRWHCIIDPSFTKGPWTAEEDRLLHELYLKHGNKWNCIALEMNGRTEKQCRQRWIKISDGRQPKYRKKMHEIAVKMNDRSDAHCLILRETNDEGLKKVFNEIVKEKNYRYKQIGKLVLSGGECTGYFIQAKTTEKTSLKTLVTTYTILEGNGNPRDSHSSSNNGDSFQKQWGACVKFGNGMLLLEAFRTQIMAKKNAMVVYYNLDNHLFDGSDVPIHADKTNNDPMALENFVTVVRTMLNKTCR